MSRTIDDRNRREPIDVEYRFLGDFYDPGDMYGVAVDLEEIDRNFQQAMDRYNALEFTIVSGLIVIILLLGLYRW